MMCLYNRVCVHIKGEDNVWADILGRWSAPRTIRRIVSIPPVPSTSSADFEWSVPENVCELQQQYETERPWGLVWKMAYGEIKKMLLVYKRRRRICNCGSVLLLTQALVATVALKPRKLLRKTLSQDIRTFVKACIHCLSTTEGNLGPSGQQYLEQNPTTATVCLS